MAMKFRESPKGDVDLANDNTQILRRPPTFGAVAKDVAKVVLSDEPVRKISGKGQWFEVRIEDFCGGYLSLAAIGFTATDPASLEDSPLPPRAYEISKTYLAGYIRSAHWNGEHVVIEELFKTVKPGKIFTLGALATLEGKLEIYIDRRLVLCFDPTVRGLQPITTDEPLYAVVDCVSAIRKATLLTHSVPPSEEEAQGGAEGEHEG